MTLRILSQTGKLEGSFQLTPMQVAGVRDTIEAEQFFSLPEEIGPEVAALHMPDFRLEVQEGARKHKVALYSPADMKSSAQVMRFIAVWNRFFKELPVRPAW